MQIEFAMGTLQVFTARFPIVSEPGGEVRQLDPRGLALARSAVVAALLLLRNRLGSAGPGSAGPGSAGAVGYRFPVPARLLRKTEGERAEAAVPQVPDAGTNDVMPEAPVQIPQETRLRAELEDIQRLSAAGSLEDSGQRTAGPVADVGTAAAAAMAVHDVRSWDVEQMRAFLQ